jgi:hypothetical protein
MSTSTQTRSAFAHPSIITRVAYPTGTPCVDPEEIGGFAIKTSVKDGNGLNHFLALISDCAYSYELADDFHDPDMKMAYLTMKHAWQRLDPKPFLSLAARNRKVLNWTIVMMIWAFVKPENDDYWAECMEDLPAASPARTRDMLTVMTAIRDFRNEWKAFHEAGRIASIGVSVGMGGWSVQLYGK